MIFKCDCCGLCCKHIAGIEELSDFDLGNGVCKFLTPNNKCSIYKDRPLICRVDEFYHKYLAETMSLAEWHELNEKCCVQLKDI